MAVCPWGLTRQAAGFGRLRGALDRRRPWSEMRYNSSLCLDMPLRAQLLRPARRHNVRIYRGLPARADEPIALTIGNFDGVHRGHQAMLSRLLEAAEDLRLPPAVLTFDPHPREFFARGTAPPRLSTLRQKLDVFRAFGIASIYVARFDAKLAALSPHAFIDDVLVSRLGVRWVLVGDDFRFGKGRAGDLKVLRAHAATFSVEGMRTLVVAGERASSTAVREALARRRPGARRSAARPALCARGARGPRGQAGPQSRLSHRQHRVAPAAGAVRYLCRVRARPGCRSARGGGEPWGAPHGEGPAGRRCSKCSSSISTRRSTDAASRSSSCTSCAMRRSTTTSPRSRNRLAPMWRKPARISRARQNEDQTRILAAGPHIRQ